MERKEFENMGYSLLDFLKLDIVDEILEGKYNDLVNIDIIDIVEKFNSGNYNILNDEIVDKFVNMMIDPKKIVRALFDTKDVLEFKRSFDERVQKLKDGMNYKPENYTSVRDPYYGKSYTYKDLEMAFDKAEKFYNSEKVYSLLRYSLRYGKVAEQIVTRKRLFSLIKKFPDSAKGLLELIKNGDSKLGIVRTEDSDLGVSIGVGSKKEMAISNIIGFPFNPDLDLQGYEYGPYGERYCAPRKVTKTFHEGGITEKHEKMIRNEKIKRAMLDYTRDEKGFILAGVYALIISKKELIDAGLNPKTIGWQPLKIRIKPESITSLLDRTYDYCPISRKVSFGKNLVLK